MYFDNNKVAIIGCGRVGMSAAYSLLHSDSINELVLFGRHKEKLIGEKLDLDHGISFLHPTKIIASDNYQDLINTDIVVITAGAAQKPGQTRLDLMDTNTKITSDIVEKVIKVAPHAIIIMVTNPVDILTFQAWQRIKEITPFGRLFGSGTVLDTSRFRFHLSEFLKVNPRSIHSYILGEHGDSSFPAIKSASVGGQSILTLPGFDEKRINNAYQKARDAAYKIIEAKGSTYYGIGVVISYLVKTVLNDAKTILPVSIPLHNYYGVSDIALSVPCVVGRNGVEKIMEINLSKTEEEKFQKSANNLKNCLKNKL
jgi:L-lactate dehydrogenase